jgi:predicted DNA-binding protein
MKSISVRFPDELHERLKQASETDRRSVNAEILWLVEQGLEHAEGGSGVSSPA